MFSITIQSMYKSWKGLIVAALSVSALLELGLKAFAHYHPEVSDKVNIAAWQLPLFILGAATILFVIVFFIHWIDAKKRDKPLRYYDDTYRIEKLEEQMRELKQEGKMFESGKESFEIGNREYFTIALKLATEIDQHTDDIKDIEDILALTKNILLHRGKTQKN